MPPVRLPRGWRRPVAAFLLATLLVVLIAEGVLRSGIYWYPRWYPSVIDALDGQPAEAIFIGSSRVSAAIDAASFSTAAGHAATRTFNVGQGFSTIAAHALGLRNLGQRGLLRGTVVFIEAPMRLPDQATWTDHEWYQRPAPHFLLTVLQMGDIPGLWRSRLTFEDKLAATIRWSFSPSLLATSHEDIRVKMLTGVYHRVTARAPVETEDRGVRGDIDDLARIQRAAAGEGARMNQIPAVDDWSGTIVSDIVAQVHRDGGRVVFYDMPMSPAMQLDSPNAIRSRTAFLEYAARWQTPVLVPDATFGDEDFPDRWHLSNVAQLRFTDALAATWVALRSTTR